MPRMPVVFVAFLVASLAIVGLPPMAGMWSKFLLVTASFGSGEWITAAALIISSLLSLVYLAPIAFRALYPPMGAEAPRAFIRPGGAPGVAVAAIVITAAGCVVLFGFADAIAGYLAPVRTETFVEGAP